MNKELQAILTKIENKKNEARKLSNSGDIAGARVLLTEIETLREEYDVKNALLEEKRDNAIENNVSKKPENSRNSKVKEFFNAICGRTFDNAMVSGTNSQGGYTVPEDIDTEITNLLEAEDHLARFVRVEPVNTESGEYTFQRRNSGYIHEANSVAELAAIQEAATPEFARLPWKVHKFANFYRASNEVLNDTDANLRRVMVNWILNVSRVTRNNIIRVVLQSPTVQDAFDLNVQRLPITQLKDIKTISNVRLDKAFWNSTSFITNQTGFNVLDTMQYPDGRFVLQESITSPSGKTLFGRHVDVVSDNDLPNQGDNAPLVIGDLKEGILLLNRRSPQIRSSDIAGEAWRTDSVEWRHVERLDCQLRDAQAFVYGTFSITDGIKVPATAPPLAQSLIDQTTLFPDEAVEKMTELLDKLGLYFEKEAAALPQPETKSKKGAE